MIEEYEITIQEKAEAGLTAMLRSGIYKDPISVAVRETLANALDIHREHHVQKPVQVTLYKDRISIRDFGPGIGQDTIRTTFFAYGGSTKIHDKNQIGGFGIGAKAPLCYSDTMTVRSINKGTLAVWTAAVDEAGGRIYNILEESTDEPSGLEVNIPLSREHQNGSSIGRIAVYLLLLNLGQEEEGQRVNVILGDSIDCGGGRGSSEYDSCHTALGGTLTLIPNPLQKVMKEDPVLSRVYNMGLEEGLLVPAWHMDTILSVIDVNGNVGDSWNTMMNLLFEDKTFRNCRCPSPTMAVDRFLVSGMDLVLKCHELSNAELSTYVISGSYILKPGGNVNSGEMNVESLMAFKIPNFVIRQPIDLLKFTAGRCEASTDFSDERWKEVKYPFILWDIYKLANELKSTCSTEDWVTLTLFLKSVCDLWPLAFSANQSDRNSYSSDRRDKWKNGWLRRKRTFIDFGKLEIGPAFKTGNNVRYSYDLRIFSTSPDRNSIASLIPDGRISKILGSISGKFGCCVSLLGGCAKAPVRNMIERQIIGGNAYWTFELWEEVFHVSDKLVVRRAGRNDENIGISRDIYAKTPVENVPRKYSLTYILDHTVMQLDYMAFTYRKTSRSQNIRAVYSLHDPEEVRHLGMSRLLKDHTPYIIQQLNVTKNTIVFPEYPTSDERKILLHILNADDSDNPVFDGIVFRKEGCVPDAHQAFRSFIDSHYSLKKLVKKPVRENLKTFRKSLEELKDRYPDYGNKDDIESATFAAGAIKLIQATELFDNRENRGLSNKFHIWEDTCMHDFMHYHLGEKRYQELTDWASQLCKAIPPQWKEKITYVDAYYDTVLRPHVSYYNERLSRGSGNYPPIKATPEFLMKIILELSDKVAEMIDKLQEGWKNPTSKLPKLW